MAAPNGLAGRLYAQAEDAVAAAHLPSATVTQRASETARQRHGGTP